MVTDHLGTPRELLDESGQLGWSNSPNVWGQARLWQAANDEFASSNVVPINKTTCPIRFPGQYYDEESGLHYNRHRYYDPETAQYLSPDPLGLGGGTRPQGYVDNPLSWVDPLGLASYDGLRPEPGYERGKVHGIKWQESDAIKRAQETGNPQGKWGNRDDLKYAGQQASELPTGPNGKKGPFFDIPINPDHKSVVYNPDGSKSIPDLIRIRNNGNGTFHGFPIDSKTAGPIFN
ncbi:RHS domain-containing protein [Pseudomonas protegens]|nr:RHS domain-containing protein [Pseudomonas protegens]